LRRFAGHTAGVEDAVFSPDGKYILTGSDDKTARLWDVDYHTTLQYLCSRLLRNFTPDERAQYGITDTTPTCPPNQNSSVAPSECSFFESRSYELHTSKLKPE
jgi:WD40 repeat protein